MLTLDFDFGRNNSPCILCLGAHCDDIEIGCGGSILRLLSSYPSAKVYWVVFSGNSVRSEEARQSAAQFLSECAEKHVYLEQFRDSFFPYIGSEIKVFFNSLQQSCQPNLIFTHYRHDLHQDHRLISELTWNAFRDHLILEYEIPKWDGDLGQPNFFVHLDEKTLDQKIAITMNAFQSQKSHDWFTKDTFTSLMRLRGMESRSPSQYAEGFYCRKAVY